MIKKISTSSSNISSRSSLIWLGFDIRFSINKLILGRGFWVLLYHSSSFSLHGHIRMSYKVYNDIFVSFTNTYCKYKTWYSHHHTVITLFIDGSLGTVYTSINLNSGCFFYVTFSLIFCLSRTFFLSRFRPRIKPIICCNFFISVLFPLLYMFFIKIFQ